MTHYAITAIGRDRPGIVAAISGVLLEVEGNIEDSQMSILRGHFAVMLIVSVPDGVGREDLERRMGEVRSRLELEAIAVNEVGEGAGGEGAGGDEPTHVLSVYGADHPGIVHSVSEALAQAGANVTDLQTKLTGIGEGSVYVMLIEIAVPGDPAQLRESLQAVGGEAGLDVSLRELEAEAF